jgi:hypothetical protein
MAYRKSGRTIGRKPVTTSLDLAYEHEVLNTLAEVGWSVPAPESDLVELERAAIAPI